MSIGENLWNIRNTEQSPRENYEQKTQQQYCPTWWVTYQLQCVESWTLELKRIWPRATGGDTPKRFDTFPRGAKRGMEPYGVSLTAYTENHIHDFGMWKYTDLSSSNLSRPMQTYHL